MIGVFAALINCFQMLFYLKAFNFVNNQVRLFANAFYDALPTIVFLMIWMIIFAIIFVQLGVRFDEGQRELTTYNTHLDGDYPRLSYLYTVIIAMFRNTIGDLCPPTYEYWLKRMDQPGKKDIRVEAYYIWIIWFFWLLQIVIMVVTLLNFLIAII